MLAEISFDIQERDLVSVIGSSGRGNTTVFNTIASLLEPDRGTLVHHGAEVASLRGRIGYMMQ